MTENIINFVTRHSYMFIYFLVINVITFIVYYIDKQKAKKHKYRISEATLIAFAAAGGSVFALLAMYLIRHKVRKPKFYIGVPLILVLQIIAMYLLIKYKVL